MGDRMSLRPSEGLRSPTGKMGTESMVRIMWHLNEILRLTPRTTSPEENALAHACYFSVRWAGGPVSTWRIFSMFPSCGHFAQQAAFRNRRGFSSGAPMNSQGRCAPWIPRVSLGLREESVRDLGSCADLSDSPGPLGALLWSPPPHRAKQTSKDHGDFDGKWGLFWF